MYAYDELDRTLLNERVSEFPRPGEAPAFRANSPRTNSRCCGCRNGVYLQLHAYMFRVAIPYGTLSSKQLRRLAHVARRYDRGYGHFTTRQNIQYNWIKPRGIAGCPGRSRRSRHSRHADLRQQHAQRHLGPMGRRRARRDRGSAHLVGDPPPAHHAAPEFSFLPRKFKIAITASEHDRARSRSTISASS